MQPTVYFLLLNAIAEYGAVSAVNFNLTYQRIGDNELILSCSNHPEKQNLRFWINETEKIDIVNELPLEHAAVYMYVVQTVTVVSFVLRPKYEGTFYCGEKNGDRSNGVGPMAGKIAAPTSFVCGLVCIYGCGIAA